MKKLSTKRTVALLSAALLSISGLAGCSTERITGLEDFKNRPNKVSVIFNENAYGKEWITEVAREYMTNYNEDTYIDLEQTFSPGTEFSKIQADSASADLYLFDQHLQNLEPNVENLEDVWNSYALGEEDTEGAKLIKDKLTPLLKSWNDNYNTRAFSIPYSQGTTYGFVYNKTVLDASFPDGYTLPRTTNELFEMGDALKTVDLEGINEEQDVYLMCCSYADGNENLRYSMSVWFYQLMGYEKAEQYFNGRYWDETEQKYLFDETKPTTYEKYKTELMDFYNVVYNLNLPTNKYVHVDSLSMDYMYAGAAEAGAGFKANKSKTVFKIDAPYFESETKMFLESLKNRGQEQTMGMMRFPVASAIINRLETIDDEATLREAISYVDGDTTTKPEGVSDADIEILVEARGFTPMYLGGGMVIPRTAANKEGAKEFIRFLCSDAAAIVSARALDGLEIIPYGKTTTSEELGFEKGHFQTTVSEWSTKNTILTGCDGLFATWGSFTMGEAVNTVGSTIFAGRGSTADAWWQSCYNKYAYDWADRVKDYKAHGGDTSN